MIREIFIDQGGGGGKYSKDVLDLDSFYYFTLDISFNIQIE